MPGPTPSSADGRGDIHEDEIWIRRGPTCAKAGRHEIEAMIGGQRRVTVLNFSHPITDSQQETLRLALNCRIGQIVERRAQFDNNLPFEEQVRELGDSVGVTPHVW